jgi:hypothetical protein
MLEITETPELVFFVTAGEAYCLDCKLIVQAQEPEATFIPVFSDGTGDDGCGLICACGAEYDMETHKYIE